MEFSTIQHKDTLEVIMFFVDNKRVNRNKYLHLEHLQYLRGCHYSNSVTAITKSGNFRHSATL